MPPTPKIEKYEKSKIYKNENLQKHIILVNLGLREYQNRIQHVHKSAHAKYELCSCQERRVMTSLRQNRYLRIQGRMQFFRSISCFWMFNLQPFLDLINSKCCTHEYSIPLSQRGEIVLDLLWRWGRPGRWFGTRALLVRNEGASECLPRRLGRQG